MLQDTIEEIDVDLPDPTPILLHLGPFTLVILNPEELDGRYIATAHLPNLSISRNNHFVSAPLTPGVLVDDFDRMGLWTKNSGSRYVLCDTLP